MFDRLRNKFHSVQENLTSSIRGLSTGDTLIRGHNLQINHDVNINAGTDLLDHYQNCWAELHVAAQENALKAEQVDQLIGRLHKRLLKRTRDIEHTGTMLTHLPEVIHSVCELTERLSSLDVLFGSVEKALIQFEDLVEAIELQNKQFDFRLQLALYEKEKPRMLENFRETMDEQQSRMLRRPETQCQVHMKERREAFEDQLKHDIQLCKETSNIPKIDGTPEKTKSHQKDESILEDIKLEPEDDPA